MVSVALAIVPKRSPVAVTLLGLFADPSKQRTSPIISHPSTNEMRGLNLIL
jgi:hypothetical protein